MGEKGAGQGKNNPQISLVTRQNRFSENILFFKLLTVIAGAGKVKRKKN